MRDLLGEHDNPREADVRAQWEAAPLGARRDLVRTLMTITVHSSHHRTRTLTDRVEIAWR